MKMKSSRPHHMACLCLWLLAGLVIALVGCTPTTGAEDVVVTEVVEVGDEAVVITRLVPAAELITPTATPPPPTPAPRLHTLDLAFVGRLPNLDPQQANTPEGFDLIENLFTGLTNFNHELEQIEPELAQEWRVSPDGRTWTFSLRSDIFWVIPDTVTDDPTQPVTAIAQRLVVAADVVFAIQRACNRTTQTPDAFILFIIDGCEAVYTLEEPSEEDLARIGVRALDDTTLEITLVRPASYFLTLTSLPVFHPVPAELVTEQGTTWRLLNGDLADGWQTPRFIITSGPFLPTLLSDERIVLYRNPLWPLNTGRGNVDQVNIEFVQEQDDAFESWEAKNLDASPLPPEAREAFLARTPDKAKLVTDLTIFYVGYNFESEIFREAGIRRAFSAAIDRQALIDEMLEGRALPLRHLTPPGVIGAPPVNEVGVGYSPDYARQQLASTPFRDCKLLPPMTMLVSTADLSLLQAEIIRGMWIDELGCTEEQIRFEQASFGTLLANTGRDASPELRPDFFELAWPAYFPDAHNMLGDLLHCNNGENRQARPCTEEDNLLRQASITPDLEERRTLYRQAESGFFGQDGIFPLIPLYVRGTYTVVQTWLKYTPAVFGGEQYDRYVLDNELKQLERSRG